jgi:hypothetical protein
MGSFRTSSIRIVAGWVGIICGGRSRGLGAERVGSLYPVPIQLCSSLIRIPAFTHVKANSKRVVIH